MQTNISPVHQTDATRHRLLHIIKLHDRADADADANKQTEVPKQIPKQLQTDADGCRLVLAIKMQISQCSGRTNADVDASQPM